MTRWLVLALAGVAATAEAQTTPGRPAPMIDRLLACRTETAPAERLACFDRESDALGGAIRNHDLTLIDRVDVERSRRTMFGLSSPDQRILSKAAGRPSPAPMVHDGVIRSVSAVSFGRYAMTLADGAVWRNVDLLDSAPPIGAAVHIDRTPFGAYLLKMPHYISVHAVRMR